MTLIDGPASAANTTTVAADSGMSSRLSTSADSIMTPTVYWYVNIDDAKPGERHWLRYSIDECEKIERAYQHQSKSLLLNSTYKIDFTRMRQVHCDDDSGRWRSIKRGGKADDEKAYEEDDKTRSKVVEDDRTDDGPTATAAAAAVAAGKVDETTNSNSNSTSPTPKPASVSFFSFIRSELFVNDDAPGSSTSGSEPSQLVYNFLILPWYLERLFTLGFLICLDCFLHLFTVLPFRMGVACLSLARSLLFPFLSSPTSPLRFRLGIRLNAQQLCDLCRGLLLLTCWYGLAYINMSRLYHYIRGQSVLKLYVIFNMLQISDRLFCSFGEDILDSLFASITALATNTDATTTTAGKSKQNNKFIQIFHVVFHFAISVIYVFGHSLLLFAQVITLNVSVNSDNSSLFVVLVSNNFIELKGAVFKRFDHHNLMQISASDIVERFQLTIFLLVIMVQNLAHIGLAFAGDWLEKAGVMCFMVLGGEWMVDWIKHGFITKFNGIPPVVYRHFAKVLCTDFIHTYKHKSESSIHSVSRRLGLPSLPIAVLVVRVVYQAFLHSPSHILVKGGLLLIGCICLALLKCLLTIVLLGHSAKRVIIEPLEKERAEAFQHALHAPAHQHLRSQKRPSQFPTILPKSPTQVTFFPTPPTTATTSSSSSSSYASTISILPPAHTSTPPLDKLTGPSFLPTFQASGNMGIVSSTNSSPSLIGMKAFKAQYLALSPLSLESSASRSISRTNTPQMRSPQESTFPIGTMQSLQLPPSSASIGGSNVRPVSPQPTLAPAQSPQLSVSVTDGDGSTSDEALTARFGHINTPTALERFSAISPEPFTPSTLTTTQQTVTLQLHPPKIPTVINEAENHQLEHEDESTQPTWPNKHDLELTRINSSTAAVLTPNRDPTVTSSISVLPSGTDQVEIVQLPQPINVGDPTNPTSSIAALHIYHHQVPQSVTSSTNEPHPSDLGSSTTTNSSIDPSASIAYGPTLVTVNTTTSRRDDKSSPLSYDDASRIEQDLLTVQRYKISANKAIPV